MVSGPCQITWFFYYEALAKGLVRVSGPCQITWFFYEEENPEHAAGVSGPCQITWFFYQLFFRTDGVNVSGPCQITWFFYIVILRYDLDRFRGRVKSPGSSTADYIDEWGDVFQGRAECFMVVRFRAASKYLVLLRTSHFSAC